MKMSSFRNDMAKLGGGSVDLVTDEQSGIATLTLNNPERKNSFTGIVFCLCSSVCVWTSLIR